MVQSAYQSCKGGRLTCARIEKLQSQFHQEVVREGGDEWREEFEARRLRIEYTNINVLESEEQKHRCCCRVCEDGPQKIR